MRKFGNTRLDGVLLTAGAVAIIVTIHCGVVPYAAAQPPSPKARETHAGLDVRYDAVRTDAGFSVQLLTTAPKGATKLPAIVFVPWLSCDAAEYPGGPSDGWGHLLFDLARTSGYVLVRVEKSGMGIGDGPRCADADLDADMTGFRAALAHVSRMPEVDPARTFLLGGSIGASLAPVLARDAAPLAGIIVSGGHYKTWLEHMLEVERRRLRFSGRTPAEINATMRGLTDFYSLYLNARMTPRDIAAKRADLARLWDDAPDHQYGRPARYFQQLQALDVAGAWDRVRVPVLVVYGEYDWIMSRDDQELIVDTVNRQRAGLATLVIVPRMDHNLELFESREQAFHGRGGVYAASVAPRILQWTGAVLGERK